MGAVCWGLCGMESGAGSDGDCVCWVSPGPLWGCLGAVAQEASLALRERDQMLCTWAIPAPLQHWHLCLPWWGFGLKLGSSQGHRQQQDTVPSVVQDTVSCHAGPQGRGDGH